MAMVLAIKQAQNKSAARRERRRVEPWSKSCESSSERSVGRDNERNSSVVDRIVDDVVVPDDILKRFDSVVKLFNLFREFVFIVFDNFVVDGIIVVFVVSVLAS